MSGCGSAYGVAECVSSEPHLQVLGATEAMMGIVEIFASEGFKTTDHSYELVYGPLVEDVIECGKRLLNPSLLEIGYLSGGGIRGFQRLFPGFRYYSLDLGFPTPMVHNMAPVFADTGSDESLVAARRRMPSGQFALIVDDGSHHPEHQHGPCGPSGRCSRGRDLRDRGRANRSSTSSRNRRLSIRVDRPGERQGPLDDVAIMLGDLIHPTCSSCWESGNTGLAFKRVLAWRCDVHAGN